MFQDDAITVLAFRFAANLLAVRALINAVGNTSLDTPGIKARSRPVLSQSSVLNRTVAFVLPAARHRNAPP